MSIPIHIFMRDEDKSSFPDDLLEDMAPIYGTRCATQWLFYLLVRDFIPHVTYSNQYPKSGIAVVHRSDMERFVWNKDLFVVSLQWDFTVDQRAQIHVVSNKFQENKEQVGWADMTFSTGFCCYVPPVMHPTVTPRDPARGETFENVVYMGAPRNLDPAFKTREFKRRVEDLGMRFIIVEDPKKHDDFSNVDVALAVRDIGKLNTVKPAVKLYNAWRGGVPALLGVELGYREERRNEYDYIEIDSVDDVVRALKKLKTDVTYRKAMIENAAVRSKAYTPAGQRQNWEDFFEKYVYPEYEKWNKHSSLSKRIFLLIRWCRYASRHGLASGIRELFERL